MTNCKLITCSPDSLIRDAMKSLDARASRIVLVTNEDQVLLGTVTDGDIAVGTAGAVTIQSSNAVDQSVTAVAF